MKNTCLLVVDIQTAMMQYHPYRGDEFISGVKRLIGLCREKDVEIVYVRHCGKAGGAMEQGADGWQIYSDIAPREGEKIFDKHFNSAFRQSGLKNYLDEAGIKTIILVGMQTDFCIDVTCKVAFEYEYDVIVPHMGTTTFEDTSIPAEKLLPFFENDIWDGRYARVMDMSEVLNLINE